MANSWIEMWIIGSYGDIKLLLECQCQTVLTKVNHKKVKDLNACSCLLGERQHSVYWLRGSYWWRKHLQASNCSSAKEGHPGKSIIRGGAILCLALKHVKASVLMTSSLFDSLGPVTAPSARLPLQCLLDFLSNNNQSPNWLCPIFYILHLQEHLNKRPLSSLSHIPTCSLHIIRLTLRTAAWFRVRKAIT